MYVGDPNVEHKVTGSPLGTNVFRIEGPNIGGPGVDMIETGSRPVSAPVAPATTGAWTVRNRGGVSPNGATRLYVESSRGGVLKDVTFTTRR